MSVSVRIHVFLAVLSFSAPVLAAYPFSDSAESGAGNWIADPPWGVTAASAHGGLNAFTDSPGSNYANNAATALTLGSTIDLSHATRPRLSFWHRYTFEPGFDFGRVEISINGGSTWDPTPVRSYSDTADWTREQIDLAPWLGQAAVKIRFRVVTDGTVTQDGWYVDDILVDEGPAAVTLGQPSSPTANSLTLGWSASADSSFTSYRLVRGSATGFDWQTAPTVATITDKATTTTTDARLAPKSTYWYRVVVARGNGLETASNEVSGATLAGIDVPFLDTGEAGPNTWTADFPWALSTAAAHGGTRAWSDSPAGDYAPNLSGTSLTLAAPMNLSSFTHPVLSFWHKCTFPGNDHGLVEVSTNGGQTWTALADFANVTVAAWTHVQCDLSAWRVPDVLVRFRVTTDAWTEADGWHVDDISVSEQPATVAAPYLSGIGATAVTVAWLQNSDVGFDHYAVHRAQPSGASMNAPLVANVASRTTLSLTDTNLPIGTTYAWRVYAVNAWGAYGADSPTESTATTTAFALPFNETFESGLARWNVTGAWSTTTLVSHGGSASLQDSPGDYANSSDTTLSTQLDLSAAAWPVLSFWDRYDFEAGADYGRIEVSSDGAGWTGAYGVSGTRGTWLQRQVDLSPWRGQPRVWIRFRVQTDGGSTRDGWLIDDLSVVDRSGATLPLPFFDGFESGMSNWLAGSWEPTSDAHGGAQALTDFGTAPILPSGWYAAHVSAAFDLSAAAAPQLVFWIKGSTGYQQSIRAQASTDNGLTWSDAWVTGGAWPAWTRVQVALTPFKSAATRLRFVTTSGCCFDAVGVTIDDVSVEDAPAAPVLAVPTPHLKSMDLAWSAPALPDFKQYEVYRKASGGVDLSATKIATITNAATKSFTDTGLAIGKTYWYRVYIVTTEDTYSGSGELAATTSALPLPVIDTMESPANWSAEGTNGTWGVGTSSPHGGGGYFSDSPGGAYADNMDTALTTAVDLRAATWPVLTFWDRFDFQVNADVGRVEVSIDSGNSWTGVYAATGTRAAWMRRDVDLSPWKGNASVMVRFRSVSDGATVGDGWSVDDLSIAEYVPVARTLPFTDGFESGTTNWLGGNWEISTTDTHKGTGAVRDFPRSAIPWGGWFTNTLAGTFDLSASTAPQLVFWVRGFTGYQQSIRAQVSTDGGVSWPDLWVTAGSGASWQRVQVDLTPYRNAGVRLRFVTTSGCCWDAPGVTIDDVAVEEAPKAPTMGTPIPHLKSIDVSWSAPAIANFKHYEVYRKTSAGVDLSATKIATITDASTTSFTDTGLSIGKNYWYRVYVVTQEDASTPSNEISSPTTALNLPVVDGMESDANWVAEGTNGTWSVATQNPHAGTGCFTDSPAGAFLDNMDASLVTAVNLSAATWPVLTFWDRFDFPINSDLGRVEVSVDSGNSWTGVYAATGTRTGWTRRDVDLSPWRGIASVMIRFRSVSDGGATGDGWSVDDVTIANATPPVRTLPFYDGFEGGVAAWYASNWEADGSAVHAGASALAAFPRTAIPWGGWFNAGISGAFDLSSTTNPQWTFWIKGSTGYQQSIRAQVSNDGGLNWQETWVTAGPGPAWTRIQLSLASFRTAGVRLRFATTSGCCWDAPGISIDDVAVEEGLAKPALAAPDGITMRAAHLSWSRSTAPNFQKYVLYRSTSPSVTEGSTVVATITNPATTEYTDATLDPRSRYFYRVFAYSSHDVGIGSDEAQVLTLGPALPLADDFEADSGAWTMSGTWGRQTSAGRGGGTALTDSPGIYGSSVDAFAQLGVDLRGLAWPVLSFWEKHEFEVDADWGRVEVSSDFGASWTSLVAQSGTGATWTERRVDLSPWRNETAVWVRLRVMTDGGTSRDGWVIDDVRLGENTLAPHSYPFFDGFENGLDAWLQGQWTPGTASPHRGTGVADNSPGYSNPWSGWYLLTLGSALDLSQATSPAWTFYYRGVTGYQQSIRAQLSTDGGVNWFDVWAIGFNNPAWQKASISLDGYKQAGLRFRFAYTGGCCTGEDGVYLDDVGIGGPAPAAPSVATPLDGAPVGVLRPALTVNNAFDPQTDPLTYSFEVFTDAALTQRVAQVPAVAEGDAKTTWNVDVDLADNHTYWWRCRANDGGSDGPWMTPATFTIVLTNDAPSVPEFVAPLNGASLFGPDATLTWFRSADPNPGDTVTYELTVDDDATFQSPAISETDIVPVDVKSAGAHNTVTVTLGSLAGYSNLLSGHAYYWRLRAVDNRGLASAWTSEVRYFQFGQDGVAPTVAWSTPAEGATLTSTPVILSGTASDSGSGLDYVQVSVDGGATWQLAAGAGSWSHAFSPRQNGDVKALVRAADRAGNVSVPLERGFTVALPDIPAAPRSAPDNSVITLSWNPPALPGATGYNVYRTTTSGSGYVKINAVPLTSTTYRDTGLANGTLYHYVATATFAARPESGYSPEVSARPMGTGRAPFVDDLRLSRSGADLRLDWSALTLDPGTGPAACAGYWVYEGATPDFKPAQSRWQHYVTGTTATYPGGASDAARHYFHVTSVGGDGREGFWTQWFAEEDDPLVQPSLGWSRVTDPRAWNGSFTRSSQAGAKLTFRFNGTGASLAMGRGPACGIASIALDGVAAGSIDLYAMTEQLRGWMYHVRGLTDGQHTLEVTVSGTKNANSTGYEVSVDRILTGREAGLGLSAGARPKDPAKDRAKPAQASTRKKK